MFLGCLTIVFVCVVILCLAVPGRYWETVRSNCYRSDGTFSKRRFSLEAKAFVDYVTLVAVPILFAGLGALVGFTYFFSHIIPLDLVLESFRLFDFDPNTWQQNLIAVQRQHAFFLLSTGVEPEAVQGVQSALWDGLAVYVGLGAVLATGFVVFLFKCVVRSVSVFVHGVRLRKQNYALNKGSRRRSRAKEALV